MSETLPNWFWTIYYLFLLVTLGTALLSVIKRKMSRLSFIAIVLTLAIPLVSLINSIGRPEEMNEFEYLVSQLQQGAIWPVFIMVGYLFLIVWWGLFLFKSKAKK
ncbi:membrane protein [Bacillus sp. FJAT-27916]|uniref:hypothetical protein n=1 Tax=Bacillus sp. FJAT-27916 TaxID=1679169 RepID=UPI000670EFD7|nr:hypothetical protein [Bacillus sp. FJAT-27916]KMY43983.1 membrane protein [Bacillus sp. FJAT-27916]